MPNWCNTYITIQCTNKEQAQELYNKIDLWSQKNYMENGFGESWLGNIVGFSGIGDPNDVFCRGWLDSLEIENDCIFMQEESAWAPALNMWQLIIDKYAHGASITYEAEELGFGLLCSNDPDVCDTYVVLDSNGYDEIFGSTYDWSEKELATALRKLLKSNVCDVKSLLDELKNSEYSESIYIKQYEYADVSDFE